MTKRYREALEEVVIAAEVAAGACASDGSAAGGAPVDGAAVDGAAVDGTAVDGTAVDDPRGAGAPTSFRWRGSSYTVLQVLGHWREDAGWWRRPDGVPVQLERTDLWRVEAQNGRPSRGVYELVRRGDTWRLDRVWD